MPEGIFSFFLATKPLIVSDKAAIVGTFAAKIKIIIIIINPLAPKGTGICDNVATANPT